MREGKALIKLLVVLYLALHQLYKVDAVLGQSRPLISLATLTPKGHPYSCAEIGRLFFFFN